MATFLNCLKNNIIISIDYEPVKKYTLESLSLNYTFLELCSKCEDIEYFQEFIETGKIDVNFTCDGKTPLLTACVNKNDTAIQFLLSQPDIDVNLNNPLMEACYNNNIVNVELLLSHPKIDVNANCIQKKNTNPLSYSYDKRNTKIVKKLLSHPKIDLSCTSPIYKVMIQLYKEELLLLLSHPKFIITGRETRRSILNDLIFHLFSRNYNQSSNISLLCIKKLIQRPDIDIGESIDSIQKCLDSIEYEYLFDLNIGCDFRLKDTIIRNNTEKLLLSLHSMKSYGWFNIF